MRVFTLQIDGDSYRIRQLMRQVCHGELRALAEVNWLRAGALIKTFAPEESWRAEAEEICNQFRDGGVSVEILC